MASIKMRLFSSNSFDKDEIVLFLERQLSTVAAIADESGVVLAPCVWCVGDGCVGDGCVGNGCVGDGCVGDGCVGDGCDAAAVVLSVIVHGVTITWVSNILTSPLSSVEASADLQNYLINETEQVGSLFLLKTYHVVLVQNSKFAMTESVSYSSGYMSVKDYEGCGES
ncbi:hypothetical protein Tco_0550305 [Tanacetum coccineum]